MIYIYLAIYILIINIIGFIMMYIDKEKAKKDKYRISEKTFFVISLLLGAIGTYIGMYKFRHKTKHNLFTIGIPVMIVLNLFTVYFIISKNVLEYIIEFINKM
jgi:uncharacterized membrane protein YsdA (DUF1294 family)